ncbi:MAG: DUF4037 domain-containing protein, partial [Anaerolineae bacterium]|nr:DUF4037 domain-containing protein [Anaerolineae bacterium]
MPEFIPGLKLGADFFHEAVKPVIAAHFPGLHYSAALIGSGSEILGFDTAMSSDHHWGPRAMLFLSDADFADKRDALHDAFATHLPYTFRGYSTHFSPPDPNDNGVQHLNIIDSGPVNHRVEIMTLRGFFGDYLDIDPFAGIDIADWLTFPQQKLRTVTAGAVYHDDLGLESIRAKLAYYPQDVWLYLLVAGWTRIGQEEPFVGRAGYVGDDLGSQVIAARLVRDIMRLCFLMERQYAPYSKWFGTAFSKLAAAEKLNQPLRWALLAQNWRERELYLSEAYETLAALHNALNITAPQST